MDCFVAALIAMTIVCWSFGPSPWAHAAEAGHFGYGRTPTPQDSEAAERLVAQLTGMTPESAQTFMDFVSGMRWLRPLTD